MFLHVFSDAESLGYTMRIGVKNDFIEQYGRRGDIDSKFFRRFMYIYYDVCNYMVHVCAVDWGSAK